MSKEALGYATYWVFVNDLYVINWKRWFFEVNIASIEGLRDEGGRLRCPSLLVMLCNCCPSVVVQKMTTLVSV